MRWSIVIVGFSLCGALAFTQAPPAQVFSSDLVSWTYMQEPQPPEANHQRQQPTPEPSPETQPAPNPSQPGAHPNSPSGPQSESQAPVAQTFTGTINKEDGGYVLKVSETASYKLDNEQEVQPYEGRRVKVTGRLDSAINLIHVDKVEPLS
jgi:Protein of unknown function (DUF5818)